MIYYSQNDPRWKNIKFKDCQKSTLGQNACLLSSLCNARLKFYPSESYDPLQASKDWVFVKGADGEAHWLDWIRTDFPGFAFTTRVRCSGVGEERKFNNDDMERIKGLTKSPDYAVVVEVLTKSGGRHWLFVRKCSLLGGLKVVDPWPWPANVPSTTVGMFGRYVRYTGYAIIHKKS